MITYFLLLPLPTAGGCCDNKNIKNYNKIFVLFYFFNLYFSAVEEKPSSAGSKKTPADTGGGKTPDPDLVEVKTGSYTKK